MLSRKIFFSISCACFLLLGGFVASAAQGNPGADNLSQAILQKSEIVLDGTVDFNNQGTLLYASDDTCVVVLEGIGNVGLPGQHIMVIGYPYRKDGTYYLSVTGYTFLSEQ